MPKPLPQESKSEYIDRCMADSEMNDKYSSSSERYAVCSGIYKTEMALKEKISFDYDGTLSTADGKKLARKLISEGNTLYIISARNDKQGMIATAKEIGIPLSRIYATGSNKAKIEKINELGINKHYDNNPSVIDALKGLGMNFMEFESYNDYPEQAKENAKIALRWAEKNGWGDCGTPVGKQRANQLAKGENISEDTISRMASFERQRQNSNKPLGDGCGRLMWLAWGGDAGIEWATRKLKQIKNK